MYPSELFSTSDFAQGNDIRINWRGNCADYIVTRANNVHFAINVQTGDAITRPVMNDFIRAFGGRIVVVRLAATTSEVMPAS